MTANAPCSIMGDLPRHSTNARTRDCPEKECNLPSGKRQDAARLFFSWRGSQAESEGESREAGTFRAGFSKTLGESSYLMVAVTLRTLTSLSHLTWTEAPSLPSSKASPSLPES